MPTKKSSKAKKSSTTKALHAFVDAVNSTGGVVKTLYGGAAPVGDSSWADLGAAYLLACSALRIPPEISEGDDSFE